MCSERGKPTGYRVDLVTSPDLMQIVQTNSRWGWPATRARMVFRLGRNRRLVRL
jgi:hypothetical protein